MSDLSAVSDSERAACPTVLYMSPQGAHTCGILGEYTRGLGVCPGRNTNCVRVLLFFTIASRV